MPYSYLVKGPGKRQDSVDTRLNRVITHHYELVTDDDTLDEVGASVQFTTETGIGILSAHPNTSLTSAYVVNIDCEQDTDSALPNLVWRIAIKYTTNIDSALASSSAPALSGPSAPAIASQQAATAPADRQAVPTSRPVDCVQTGIPLDFPVLKDRNGKAIANTLGDLFDPGTIQRSSAVCKYKISINRSTVSGAHYAYQGMVNNASVTIPRYGTVWGTATLKFRLLEIEEIREDVLYFRHNYYIEAGPYWNYDFTTYLGWNRQVANTGRRFWATLPDTLVRIINFDVATGAEITEPVFMDQYSYKIDTTAGGWESNIWHIDFQPDYRFNMSLLWV